MGICSKCNGSLFRPGLHHCKVEEHPQPNLMQSIVLEIEYDLTDRRGLRQAFEGIDDETQCLIRDVWCDIISEHLEASEFPLIEYKSTNTDRLKRRICNNLNRLHALEKKHRISHLLAEEEKLLPQPYSDLVESLEDICDLLSEQLDVLEQIEPHIYSIPGVVTPLSAEGPVECCLPGQTDGWHFVYTHAWQQQSGSRIPSLCAQCGAPADHPVHRLEEHDSGTACIRYRHPCDEQRNVFFVNGMAGADINRISKCLRNRFDKAILIDWALKL